MSPRRALIQLALIVPAFSTLLGLLETDTTFEQTRLRNRVNRQAYVYRDDPDFSVKIRRL